jgi:bacterioferritin (cytochrome b1)
MQITDRELWLLNLYRNSELHGALLMARLARSVSAPALVLGATRHCATEAEHAARLTEAIVALGGRVDPLADTIQRHYSQAGGTATQLVDLLVLSEVLESRVLASYREHLQRVDAHPQVRRVLQSIICDEEAHSGEHGWVEQALAEIDPVRVVASRSKWSAIDSRVAEALHAELDRRFAPGASA